jgi:hypothetical protein
VKKKEDGRGRKTTKNHPNGRGRQPFIHELRDWCPYMECPIESLKCL